VSKEASERSKPKAQTSQASLARALVAACALLAVTVFVYWQYLSALKPAGLVVKQLGGDVWALWPLVAVGTWASHAHAVNNP